MQRAYTAIAYGSFSIVCLRLFIAQVSVKGSETSQMLRRRDKWLTSMHACMCMNARRAFTLYCYSYIEGHFQLVSIAYLIMWNFYKLEEKKLYYINLSLGYTSVSEVDIATIAFSSLSLLNESNIVQHCLSNDVGWKFWIKVKLDESSSNITQHSVQTRPTMWHPTIMNNMLNRHVGLAWTRLRLIQAYHKCMNSLLAL